MTDLVERLKGFELLANEYQDFIEFLDDELGVEIRKELQNKFYERESIREDDAYKNFKNK